MRGVYFIRIQFQVGIYILCVSFYTGLVCEPGRDTESHFNKFKDEFMFMDAPLKRGSDFGHE